MQQKQADIAEAQSRMGDLQQQLAHCEAQSATLQEAAAELPTLCESLLRVQKALVKRGGLPALPPNLMVDQHYDVEEEVAAAISTDAAEDAEKPGAMSQATKGARKGETDGEASGMERKKSAIGGLQRQATQSLFGKSRKSAASRSGSPQTRSAQSLGAEIANIDPNSPTLT